SLLSLLFFSSNSETKEQQTKPPPLHTLAAGRLFSRRGREEQKRPKKGITLDRKETIQDKELKATLVL
ncbi:hypothetical protein LINPERHAP1_LOCUS7744, partial [Linum perenne]